MRNYFLSNRFFVLFFGIAVLFVFSFQVALLFMLSKIFLVMLFGAVLVEIIIVSVPKRAFEVKRILPDKFSNGDINKVSIDIKSQYTFGVKAEVLEDLPYQFQKYDLRNKLVFEPKEKKRITYEVVPKVRGAFDFGNLYILVQSKLGLVKKRHVFEEQKTVACYPSFMQLRKFDFLAINNRLTMPGVKKIRKIEQNTEFSQIREYSQGDEYKHINWKSTARKGSLMVNQYQAEKSQNIYSVIDKGRAMKMPFNGMSLLDYAINASLVMSNIAIRKDDKAGLITFSRIPDSFVRASRKSTTMQLISSELYKADTNFMESDYGRLYKFVNNTVKNRSLFLLYTNFETFNAFERQLKYLRAISKKHLLVVIFFENEELTEKLNEKPITVSDHYEHTIVEQLKRDKQNIVKELRKYGIHALISKPEELTVNSINSYLGMKNKGAI